MCNVSFCHYLLSICLRFYIERFWVDFRSCSFVPYLFMFFIHTEFLHCHSKLVTLVTFLPHFSIFLCIVDFLSNRKQLNFHVKMKLLKMFLILTFSATKIFVNGCWVGIHRDPEQLMSTLRKLRREMDIIVSEV